MRPAITFFNIQLSNSRHCRQSWCIVRRYRGEDLGADRAVLGSKVASDGKYEICAG